MTKTDEDKKVETYKVAAVTPPPLSRGRKGSRIGRGVLEAMAATINGGEYASVDKTFDKRPAANTACVRFKRALVEEGLVDGETVRGRVYGEGDGFDQAPWHFAIGPKPE